jgi:hypothetical protein
MPIITLQGTLPAGTAVIYTAPIGTNANVTYIRFNNSSANTLTLQKYQAATTTTTPIYSLSLAAGDIVSDSLVYALAPGDYIEVITTTANTNYIILLQTY